LRRPTTRAAVVSAALAIAAALVPGAEAEARSARDMARDANRYYEQGEYDKAVALYREALEKDPDLRIADFNLGNALHMQKNLEEALQSYHRALDAPDSLTRAKTFYNLGNTLVGSGRLQEAVAAYVNALRLDPEDADAKHNLELARRLLEGRQAQQRGRGREKEEGEEQGQREPQPRSGGEENGREGSQRERPRGDREQDRESREQGSERESAAPDTVRERSDSTRTPAGGEEPGRQGRRITREEALRILRALEEEERKLQEMLRRRAVERRARGKKDW
jgi:Ca-activated chloride channel family protein